MSVEATQPQPPPPEKYLTGIALETKLLLFNGSIK
jgi:hypothetical protein